MGWRQLRLVFWHCKHRIFHDLIRDLTPIWSQNRLIWLDSISTIRVLKLKLLRLRPERPIELLPKLLILRQTRENKITFLKSSWGNVFILQHASKQILLNDLTLDREGHSLKVVSLRDNNIVRHISKLCNSCFNDNTSKVVIPLPKKQPSKGFYGIPNLLIGTVIRREANQHKPAFSIEINSPGIKPSIMIDKAQRKSMMEMGATVDKTISVRNSSKTHKSLTPTERAFLNLSDLQAIILNKKT
jgi:hypothetical protein